MNAQIEALKKEYAEIVRVAYKNQKVGSPLLFLFSSDDLNPATRRLSFMRRYNNSIKQKAADVEQLKNEVAIQVELLGKQQQELRDDLGYE